MEFSLSVLKQTFYKDRHMFGAGFTLPEAPMENEDSTEASFPMRKL